MSGGNLIIEIDDITCPDYTLTHELLHLLVRINNVPEIIFNLTTKNRNLDNNFLATGFELYNTVLHFDVYDMQRQMGLFTEEIQDLYLKGITETLEPEPEAEIDDVMVLRIVQLFDALVFFGKEVQKVADVFERDYPRAYRAAKQLFEVATKKRFGWGPRPSSCNNSCVYTV